MSLRNDSTGEDDGRGKRALKADGAEEVSAHRGRKGTTTGKLSVLNSAMHNPAAQIELA